MIIKVYDKNNLKIIAQPVATSYEDFKDNPVLFYPDWDNTKHICSDTEFQNPILDNEKIREMTKEELYAVGKYTLAENELIENGKIKTVSLSEYEYIENNQIKFKREEKIEQIKKELSELKTEHSEKEFVYKEKYLQRNRELDKNNLNNIATMMMATKKATFDGWKFKNKDRTDEYVTLTMQDVLELSKIMTEQTTKAMHTETVLRESLVNLSDEDLKNYKAAEEFEKLWKN